MSKTLLRHTLIEKYFLTFLLTSLSLYIFTIWQCIAYKHIRHIQMTSIISIEISGFNLNKIWRKKLMIKLIGLTTKHRVRWKRYNSTKTLLMTKIGSCKYYLITVTINPYVIAPHIEVSVPSQESKRSCICMLRISI